MLERPSLAGCKRAAISATDTTRIALPEWCSCIERVLLALERAQTPSAWCAASAPSRRYVRASLLSPRYFPAVPLAIHAPYVARFARVEHTYGNLLCLPLPRRNRLRPAASHHSSLTFRTSNDSLHHHHSISTFTISCMPLQCRRGLPHHSVLWFSRAGDVDYRHRAAFPSVPSEVHIIGVLFAASATDAW